MTTKFKLESVDAQYVIETDRFNICENYVPTDEPSYGAMLEVVGEPEWARRILTITSKAFSQQKARWDIDGVIVRNAAGDVIKQGQML